jgi:predicted AlkP superfamily pyrophosphatase or phosphodiesterase
MPSPFNPRRPAGLARLLATFVAIVLLLAATAPAQTTAPLILISLDGWRWDYDTRAYAPNLRALAARGVRAAGLIPSFPSKTFPNHYTLVTGLYPGHHGIVANNIRDPESGRTLTMNTREEVADAMWWGGEPIWNTVRRAGGRSAAFFWPGSEAPIGGTHPDYWMPYNDRLPNEERVDQVLKWLDLPAAERPSLLTLYFNDVDAAGHAYGPDSPQVQSAVQKLDNMLGRLRRGLEERRIANDVNIVVTSDHGMSETSRRRVIVADDLVPTTDGIVVDLDPTIGVWPHPGREDAVYQRLSTAHPRLKVYRRSETPPHWHYRDHPRIPPIVGVADEGWAIMRRTRLLDAFSRTSDGVAGAHGYDPRVKNMRGIFVASGPAFRRGATVDAFENVHVYLALCEALGIAPAANDGQAAVAGMLLATRQPDR